MLAPSSATFSIDHTYKIYISDEIKSLFDDLYSDHKYYNESLSKLTAIVQEARMARPKELLKKDHEKANQAYQWFLSNKISGMSLYLDRFCTDLKSLPSKLDYLQQLGINFIHLMPLFESPENESDGGYAVSDFRKIDTKYGTIQDLQDLIHEMNNRGMYLMLDIVLNHTSHHHRWAQQAIKGNIKYQEYFYMYDEAGIPHQYEQDMPEIFPESSPGNFTYVEEINKWVMTVFHHYQWDLNFTNPRVLIEMLENILFYANLGVDVLRIDAPAFIWKQIGTACQNLPQAHKLLQIIKHAVQLATPGMALLGEAIVAPQEIMKYFGDGLFKAKECDMAYNATMMALAWEALATGKTHVMKHGHRALINKPFGTTWINYTRCHDDIGLGFSDDDIRSGGFDPFAHRLFLQSFYAGTYNNSTSRGALFSVNPKTNDARISGSLASLCGLEFALHSGNQKEISVAINKIILMQAHSFFMGGIPMIFYGDEAGYTNDYNYMQDESKSYDNRWMHRPMINWEKNKQVNTPGTPEFFVFQSTKRLLEIRSKYAVLTDQNNFSWLRDENIHLSAYVRLDDSHPFFGIFNFSEWPVYVSWYLLKEYAREGQSIYNEWNEEYITIGSDQDHLMIPGYGIVLGVLK